MYFLIVLDKPPPALACESNPCKNGGTCVDEPDGKFKCICRDSYVGVYCEIKERKGWYEDLKLQQDMKLHESYFELILTTSFYLTKL